MTITHIQWATQSGQCLVQDRVAGQLSVPIVDGMASCEAMHSYLMVNELAKIILSHLNPTGQLKSYPIVIGVASL
jgi:hypothetical protein